MNARMSVILLALARMGEAGRKMSSDTSPYEEVFVSDLLHGIPSLSPKTKRQCR